MKNQRIYSAYAKNSWKANTQNSRSSCQAFAAEWVNHHPGTCTVGSWPCILVLAGGQLSSAQLSLSELIDYSLADTNAYPTDKASLSPQTDRQTGPFPKQIHTDCTTTADNTSAKR